MKQLAIITVSILFLISCNDDKNERGFIIGKWKYENDKEGCELYFKNGNYTQTKWNDDIVNKSSGKYFINENGNRNTITLTLVPDLQYIEKDTIILYCENIDLVSITDSILITKKPTQWVHGTDKEMTRKNFTENYKKIK